MKRLFALILSLLLVAVLCSCSFINNNYYVQNDSTVSRESITESKPVEKEPVASSAEENDSPQSSKTDVSSFNYNTPFYGIWVSASKTYDDASNTSKEVTSKGFNGFVEDTTDWSNLNNEKWYVVTAGRYASEDEAANKLDEVKKYYPEAYIKYSGEYNNNASNDHPSFYGIWVSASKSYDDASNTSKEVTSKGFNGFVEDTTDWSNLNNEKWYVVTAGKYASEDEANNKLDEVKKHYPDAYVKYSGDHVDN